MSRERRGREGGTDGGRDGKRGRTVQICLRAQHCHGVKSVPNLGTIVGKGLVISGRIAQVADGVLARLRLAQIASSGLKVDVFRVLGDQNLRTFGLGGLGFDVSAR